MRTTVNAVVAAAASENPAHRRLEFTRNVTRITIDAGANLAGAYHARFDGPAPTLREPERNLAIEYPRSSLLKGVHPRRRSAAITLAAELPWEIAFGGGVSRLRVELTSGTLRSLEIAGGVSDAELHLPVPRGVVPLRIGGGARKILVVRPAHVPVALRIGGGAHNLALDRQRYGAIGGEVRLETLPAAHAADRYEIEIGGGAPHLAISGGEPRWLEVQRQPPFLLAPAADGVQASGTEQQQVRLQREWQ